MTDNFRSRTLPLAAAEWSPRHAACARMYGQPNTRLAHRLVWEADRQNRQDAIVERLSHGYFEQGLDIGSPEVLERLAADSGLDAGGVQFALTGSESRDVVTHLEQEGLRMDIQGVPFFILL